MSVLKGFNSEINCNEQEVKIWRKITEHWLGFGLCFHLIFCGHLLLTRFICPSVKAGSLFLQDRIYGAQRTKETCEARLLGYWTSPPPSLRAVLMQKDALWKSAERLAFGELSTSILF